MKPPRWDLENSDDNCSRCIYVGRYKQYDVYVCDLVEAYFLKKDCSEFNPEKLPKIVLDMVTPYYSKDEYGNMTFTKLYHATRILRG